MHAEISSQVAPVFTLPGIQFTGLAAPSRGSQDTSVWKINVAPGTKSEKAHQITREEIFIALAGEAQVMLGGKVMLLSAGSTLIVPANTDFALSNISNSPFEAVVVLPMGGQAVVDGGPPFVPPWAQ